MQIPPSVASLRDVFTHVGKRVRLERGGEPVKEGVGILQGSSGFVEAALAPRAGDLLRFLDDDRVFRVEESTPEVVRGRIDHYRLWVSPA